MITSSLGFYAFLLTLMAIVFTLSRKYADKKIFQVIPGMVWLMLAVALAATFDVFDGAAEGVENAQNLMYSTFLPMMLIMFMLTCDIRHIIKLGPRMILGFFVATFSILSAILISFFIMKGHLPEGAWGSLAAVTGSWVGETINMAAVASVFGVEGVDYVYAVMMDTIVFTIILSVSMWLIPRTNLWNKKMNASTEGIDEIAKRIEEANKDLDKTAPDMLDYCKLFAIATVGTVAINWLIPHLPQVTFLSKTGWRVVLSSVLGILLGLTPAHRLKGAQPVANVFLYLSLCVTMSYSDLSQCTQAPAFIALSLMIAVLVFVIWICLCKVFKLDLFTAQVGFMANFGGTSSAPAIAATHNPNWISFGIILGFFGDLVGTGIAIAFGNLLKYISMM
ncbi:MAG: DUF819 family protein [Lachnospiraceae bacterium]|nr:DUF819 family protein [Lachnospiraceae bacterium]